MNNAFFAYKVHGAEEFRKTIEDQQLFQLSLAQHRYDQHTYD